MIRTDLFATVLIAAGLSYGQAQAQAPSPPPNLTVEHEGRPTRYEERVDRPLYFLWHDENGWHEHSRIGGLEKKGDFGSLNRAENVLTFRFETFDRGDGLDFKVSGDATRIEFNLKINGYVRPQQVVIGPKREHPTSIPFTIPLPEKK